MKKKFIGAVAAVSILFIGSASVPALGSSSTATKNVTLLVGGETLGRFNTTKDTVDEFLEENGIELKENESIVYDDVDNIADNSTIVIESALNINVTIDGQSRMVEAKKGTTVGALIKDLTVENAVDYYYVEGKNSDVLTNDTSINLLSRSEEIFTTKDVIQFETVYQDTEELEEGVTQVVTNGVNGEKTSTVKVVFYGGEEYLKKVVSEEVTVAPVNQVIKRGVAKSVSTPNGNLKYSHAYTMSASAYTAGAESTGKNPGDKGYGVTATGMIARHGVVAVDPKVIPLGTKLYIEGYGMAIAADTGGSIKGHKIDLFYENLSSALNFGRRSVKVYVLK